MRQVFDFGSGPVNMAKFSPHGNIVTLAGFGNLRGDMQFWDRRKLQLISKLPAPDSTL